ncbi:MAG: Ig-like domain-containing protein [Gemmatimonadota bacterium]
MGAAPSNGILGGAGKWFTWTLTTAAAVTALLVNARNLGLTAWLGAVDVSFADHAATRVLVTPRADSLLSIGDTSVLAATVLDRRGAILTGARLRWLSEDTTIATVDSSGAVTARGPGRTRVSVGIRNLSASASISVIPHPTSIVITTETRVRLRQGDTLHLEAYAQDARGHRIRGARPRWRSSDPTIVAVDSFGTAVAGEPGIATMSATAGDGGAQLSLQVELTATEAHALGGDNQHALAGRRLLEPIGLRVLARAGRPVPGASVSFTPEDGLGQVEPATAIADQDGQARTSWTLSPHPGLQRLVARVGTLDSTVTFTAEADPAPGSIRVELPSGSPVGTAGGPLDQPIVLRITDSMGIPLEGLPVGWRTPDGGRLEGSERTDSAGGISARWWLGAHAGRQRLLVQIGRTRAIAPLVLVARAEAGPAAKAELLGGQSQRGTAGHTLPKPLTIRVRDGQGNPVAGAAVTIRPKAGSVQDSLLTTDQSGRLTIRWTLGHAAGEQRLQLSVDGLDSALTVSAHALAGPPAALTLTPLPIGLAPGKYARIVGRVTDAGGNPVSNALVRFNGHGGSLAPTETRSDDSGRVAVQWKADRGAVEYRITATLARTPISATQTSGTTTAAARKKG